jgi:hypothetical protein
MFVPLLAASCGGTGFPTVTGTVTLDGDPLPDAFVEFYPTDGIGSVCYGRTNAAGQYDMKFSVSKKGVMPGEYLVRIHTGDLVDDMGTIRRIPEVVPEQYNQKSELSVTVTAGRSNVFEFPLSSAGKVVQIRTP